MKPVDQTLFGHGTPLGNCFAACVASVLELELAQVPHFMGDHGAAWLPAFNGWLRPRGLYALLCNLDNTGWRPDGLHILGGQSTRGSHAVVGRGLDVVHDPHPSREGLVAIEDCTVLLPLDPARGGTTP